MLAVSSEPSAAKDRDAWDAIIRAHDHRVLVSLLALGLRPAQAREIANEAWAKLFEKRAEFETLSFPGLAITQARFLAIDALRAAARERRKREGLDAIREHAVPGEEPLWSEPQLKTIRTAIAGCSQQEQRVFRAIYANPETPHAQIAERVGLSTQRVRQILCDVRRTIRTALEKEES